MHDLQFSFFLIFLFSLWFIDLIFFKEKLKYEIAAGSTKTADELVDIFADLVNKYPRISLIIEPFSRKVKNILIIYKNVYNNV